MSRDESILAFATAIAGVDGVRLGLDALVKVLDDRRAAVAALPEFVRRQLAGRICGALGLKVAADG